MAVLAALVRPLRELQTRLRRARYRSAVTRTAARVGPDLRVNGPTAVNSHTTLGTNVNFNGLEIRGNGRVTIGNNFHSGPGCVILTRFHDFDGGSAVPYGPEYKVFDVSIGDNVWFGMNVMIVGGITIGEGAIIQAGAVVVSDVPACAIVGGNPAAVFKHRDREHYERLKRQNRFH